MMDLRKLPLFAVTLIAIGFVACGKPSRQASNEVAAPPPTTGDTTASPASAGPDMLLVSADGMGGIRLEMTLDQARQALPTATFERTSDGDGAALVEVTLAAGDSMTLWAAEDDADAAIDWSKKIRTIETFSAGFHTSEGVHPGSLVTEVERVFGRTKEIQKSEIESREYIVFEKHPSGLTFRLDYTGIFPANSRTTTDFDPGGKILSIAVSTYSTP